MSLIIKEMYDKYETIIKYSTYAFSGWVLSWGLFFIMLLFWKNTKKGVIINHTEDLGLEEYNELVNYLKIQNKSMCCG